MNGLTAERRVARYLAERDFLVSSRRRYKGAGDILAVQHPTLPQTWNPLLIEVKAHAAGPFAGFSPADRKDLSSTARQYGCEPMLAWVTNPGIFWIGEEDWPDAR